MSSSHCGNLIHALRGTLAVLTALGVAEFLRIENPYWAAMTALIVIQPTRGLLFEKSFYRLVGTVFGSLAALLMLLSTNSPLLLTIVLAIWVAGCVGIGNLLYGLRSYAFLMAACTCAVIVMSGFMNPSRIQEIAFGRIACIVIGIIATTVVTALFTPHHPRAELERRLQKVTCEAMAWLAGLLRHGRVDNVARLEQGILIELAELEALLDSAGAGSPRLRKKNRQVNNLIAALLSLLAVGRLSAEHLDRHSEADGGHEKWREILSQHLCQAAATPESPLEADLCAELSGLASEAKSHLPLLGETLGGVVGSLREVLVAFQSQDSEGDEAPRHRIIRHRDWVEAGRAAFRSGLVMAAVGVVWSATGWSKGPLMLMALAIMATIFSNKEHPAHFVGNIFIGAAIGSAAAVSCRIFLFSSVTDPYLAAAVITPFVLLGLLAMQYRATVIAATDATLFFIFVVQPGVAVNVANADMVIGALAMVMGVGTAWLSYAVLVPINPSVRMRSLLCAVSGDLAYMAATNSPQLLALTRARLQHRVIRLVDMAVRHNPDHLKVVDGGITALGIAAAIQLLREKQAGAGLAPTLERLIREALMTVSALAPQPASAGELLSRTARALYAVSEQGIVAGEVNPGSAADRRLNPHGPLGQSRLTWAAR